MMTMHDHEVLAGLTPEERALLRKRCPWIDDPWAEAVTAVMYRDWCTRMADEHARRARIIQGLRSGKERQGAQKKDGRLSPVLVPSPGLDLNSSKSSPLTAHH
jgi:hypothetical protein